MKMLKQEEIRKETREEQKEKIDLETRSHDSEKIVSAGQCATSSCSV